MSDLPEGWVEMELGQVVEPDAPIIYGILQPGPHIEDGVPYVRPTEIQNGKIVRGDLRRTSEAIAERYRRSTILHNDILLSIVGTIGKVAIVPLELSGGNITQSSCRVRARNEVMLPEFLAAFLLSPQATDQYRELSLGTAVPRLNLEDVRRIAIPVPPAPEQRRIVAKLDALTARTGRARTDLGRVPALVTRYKQAILAAVFNANAAQATAVSINDVVFQIFDGPFGSNLKSDDYVENGVRVVRLENIGHLHFVEAKRTFVSAHKFGLLQRHALKSGDVMFSSFVDEQIRVCILPELATPAINKADCFASGSTAPVSIQLSLPIGSPAKAPTRHSKVWCMARPAPGSTSHSFGRSLSNCPAWIAKPTWCGRSSAPSPKSTA